jgi:ribonuclease HI
MSHKFYAVRKGRIPGVYEDWEETKTQVDEFKGADYKAFATRSAAAAYVHPNPVSLLRPPPIPGIIKRIQPGKEVSKTPRKDVRDYDVSIEEYYKHPSYDIDSSVIYVYTDGGVLRNGSKHAVGGYGVFIPRTSHNKEVVISLPIEDKKVTNNVAELKAIIAALEEIIVMDIEISQEIEIGFCICYDSTYAYGVVTGRMNANANIELVSSAKSLLKKCQKITLDWRHIRSHTGAQDLHSLGNVIADKLAGNPSSFT